MHSFETKTFGKWILAGEHAVLRGSPALAFPLTSRHLELRYQPSSSGLEVEFAGPNGEELKLLFYGVIENALKRLNVKAPLHGQFTLTSSLPVGAGLGASAALCGAVARWCQAQGWVEESGVYEFARQLEDLFHGESSGVDLAVSLSAQGVRFVRGGERTPLKLNWWPQFYLSYCGQRGMTSSCVGQVKHLFESQPDLAKATDAKMKTAVEVAGRALEAPSLELGWDNLVLALKQGRECFDAWGLTGGGLSSHMAALERSGAVAVKPTGSGGGGYVLSLWSTPIPESLRSVLVPVPRPE